MLDGALLDPSGRVQPEELALALLPVAGGVRPSVLVARAAHEARAQGRRRRRGCRLVAARVGLLHRHRGRRLMDTTSRVLESLL